MITVDGNGAKVDLNLQLYPLECVYSAAYVFLDRAYVLLGGENKFWVKIIPKGEEDPEKVAMEFCNELVNYADYKTRAERTMKLRETLIQRALMTNDPGSFVGNLDEYVDDPLGITKPWEESGKYAAEIIESEPECCEECVPDEKDK